MSSTDFFAIHLQAAIEAAEIDDPPRLKFERFLRGFDSQRIGEDQSPTRSQHRRRRVEKISDESVEIANGNPLSHRGIGNDE
jgi:hypothetical protein